MDQSMKMQQGGAAVSAAEYITHMPAIKTGSFIFKNTTTKPDQLLRTLLGW
jgi:hypothetical protein